MKKIARILLLLSALLAGLQLGLYLTAPSSDMPADDVESDILVESDSQ